MRTLLICALLLVAGCGERSASDKMYCLVVDGEVFYQGWHEVKVHHRDGDRFYWKVFNDPRAGLANGKKVDVFKVPWLKDCVLEEAS